jgi:hypothetical protein
MPKLTQKNEIAYEPECQKWPIFLKEKWNPI